MPKLTIYNGGVTLKEPERRYLFLLKNSGQYCLTTIQRQFKLQLIKLRFIAFLKGTYPRGLCSPCGKESKYRYVWFLRTIVIFLLNVRHIFLCDFRSCLFYTWINSALSNVQLCKFFQDYFFINYVNSVKRKVFCCLWEYCLVTK